MSIWFLKFFLLFVFCLYPYLLCCYFFKVLCALSTRACLLYIIFSFLSIPFFKVFWKFSNFQKRDVYSRVIELVYYTSEGFFCQYLFRNFFRFLSYSFIDHQLLRSRAWVPSDSFVFNYIDFIANHHWICIRHPRFNVSFAALESHCHLLYASF